MRLFWIWKGLLSSLFLLIGSTFIFAQDQEAYIEEFRDSKVAYSDIGFSSAPFNISYPYSIGIDKVKFKNNYQPFLGLAFAYKWFSLRFAFPILSNARPTIDFGTTRQYNLGLDYTHKKLYFDLEYKYLMGYSIQDSYTWDSTTSVVHPNTIRPNNESSNLSINSWYFNNKNFKMNALQGKRAHFKKEVQTWYIKGTFNVFGINNNGQGILPQQLQDPNNSKTGASAFSSLDFGAVPGYAYANRIKNWQFSGWIGLGAVVQAKVYTFQNNTNGYLGLAPRYDIRFITGYSNSDYFIYFVTDFDNKSIRFNDLVYKQYYYSLKLVGGFRFDHPKVKVPKEKKQL
jgi:hypothetical protein